MLTRAFPILNTLIQMSDSNIKNFRPHICTLKMLWDRVTFESPSSHTARQVSPVSQHKARHDSVTCSRDQLATSESPSVIKAEDRE